MYHATAEEDVFHAVAYSTFYKLWNTLLPLVVIMKPMSDLCAQCLLQAANLPESEKTAAIQDAPEQLCVAQLERSYYKTMCDDCYIRHHVVYHQRSVYSAISCRSSEYTPDTLLLYYKYYSLDPFTFSLLVNVPSLV